MHVLLALAVLASTGSAAAAPELTARSSDSEQVALGASPAGAPPSASTPPSATGPRSMSAAEDRPPLLGLMLDGGFPDGLALSALLRPIRPLRVDAGLTYNLIGFGLRGGVTFVPFRAAVAPVLRGEYGHTFDGDATGIVGHFSTLTDAERIALRSVSYDYASLQLGLEIGAADRFVFFVRGGVAWFWTTVQNFQEAAQAANPGGNVSDAANPHIRGTVPTATLGLLFYFW